MKMKNKSMYLKNKKEKINNRKFNRAYLQYYEKKTEMLHFNIKENMEIPSKAWHICFNHFCILHVMLQKKIQYVVK